jgi:hypothetical protein
MVKELIRKHQDLEIYKMAFDTAMQIFELSKKFPVEERYSLTDPPGSAVAHGGNPLFCALLHQIRLHPVLCVRI